ncbi:hypothetical protein V8C44DRAFT_341333 [Trichoderma aethiopicum]
MQQQFCVTRLLWPAPLHKHKHKHKHGLCSRLLAPEAVSHWFRHHSTAALADA